LKDIGVLPNDQLFVQVDTASREAIVNEYRRFIYAIAAYNALRKPTTAPEEHPLSRLEQGTVTSRISAFLGGGGDDDKEKEEQQQQ
jgi:hypothetical protein